MFENNSLRVCVLDGGGISFLFVCEFVKGSVLIVIGRWFLPRTVQEVIHTQTINTFAKQGTRKFRAVSAVINFFLGGRGAGSVNRCRKFLPMLLAQL